MDKETSTQIKGIAILFMIWLHCFSLNAILDLYVDFTICGEKLAYFITRCAHAVDIFLILSGYGLYIGYSKNHKINVWKRSVCLYIMFLIPFAIFIPLGCLINPDKYPGSMMDFIKNITFWDTTYNVTWWFFFPYYITLFISNPFFKFIEKHGITAFITSCILFVVGFGICWMKGRDNLEIPYWLYQIGRILMFFMPMTIGACMKKYKIIETCKKYVDQRAYIPILFLLCMTIIRLSSNMDFGFTQLYAVTIVITYAVLPKHSPISRVLEAKGKHSTTMWLTHAFFMYYLFTDYIYALKYPIPIFLVVVGLSFLVAIPIDAATNIIVKKIKHA